MTGSIHVHHAKPKPLRRERGCSFVDYLVVLLLLGGAVVAWVTPDRSVSEAIGLPDRFEVSSVASTNDANGLGGGPSTVGHAGDQDETRGVPTASADAR